MRNEQAVFLTFEFNGEADKSGLLYGMMDRFQCQEIRFISRVTRIEPRETWMKSRKILNESFITGMMGTGKKTGRGD